MFGKNDYDSGFSDDKNADLKAFDDPLALKVSWLANKLGGSTFNTHNIVLDANTVT